MAFDTIITSLVVNTVKSTVRFNTSMDLLIDKFKESCPDKNQLNNIISQKNQLSNALSNTQNNFNTLNSVTSTVDNITTALDNASSVIRNLPIPTSVPPGAGIPISIIIKFSDSLEKIKKVIQQNKGATKGAIDAIKTISESIVDMQTKLNSINSLIVGCLQENLNNMSEDEKTAYLNSLNLNINNPITSTSLESQLDSNSTNPLFYKDYQLVLQYDPNNVFSFPRRRVVGIKDTTTVISKLVPDGYSYSSDLNVLIDDIKFQIDHPNFTNVSLLNDINQIQGELTQAQNEANILALEEKRGTVKFYKDYYFNSPLGEYSGYSAGEYPNMENANLIDVLDQNNGPSSLKIGRGLRLVIYKGPSFYKAPFTTNDEDNYSILEHPFDSPDEYLEISDLNTIGFNDKINSFIIDNLVGGVTTTLKPIVSPIYKPVYALKRKSLKIKMDALYNIQDQGIRYDGFINKNNSLQNSYTSEVITIWADNEDEAKQKLVTNDLVPGLLLFGPPFETLIYNNNNEYSNNSLNSIAVSNNNRVYYIEKLS